MNISYQAKEMNDPIYELWPELNWIEDGDLRARTAAVWRLALETGALTIDDLKTIPFTLLVEDCPVTFMQHKRAVVHIARRSAEVMREQFGDSLPIDTDAVIAGAILCDVGKLLEYEMQDGRAVVGRFGRYVRHPFSGVGLAMQCGIPERVCHIIATHAGEGDLVKRTTEAIIVHHADFMSFLPFTSRTG